MSVQLGLPVQEAFMGWAFWGRRPEKSAWTCERGSNRLEKTLCQEVRNFSLISFLGECAVLYG